jgi:hypothetical protein
MLLRNEGAIVDPTTNLRPEDLRGGVNELDDLARGEYGVSLAEVLSDPSRTSDDRMWRVGRLIGITVKQPFASSHSIDPATSKTGAQRGWALAPIGAKESATSTNTWQYALLSGLIVDPDLGADLGQWEGGTPDFEAVQYALYAMNSERGLWRCMAKSAQKYLCGNKALKEAVDESSRAGGLSKDLLTPSSLIGAASVSGAGAITDALPWLHPSGTVVATGMLIIIGNIGLDGFCDWVRNYVVPMPEHPDIDT